MKYFVIMTTALFIVIGVLFTAGIAFADSTSTSGQATQSKVIPDCLLSSNIGTLRECDNVNVFIWLAINIGQYLFGFIGALALLFFVYGGILLIISQGNQEKIKQGTSAMTASIIGLVIAFSAYALISFLSSTIGVAEKKGLNYENSLSHMV